MPERMAGRVTGLLADMQRGEPDAADRLAACVYDELHRIAESAMRREAPGHTLRPTELVGEAFMRLVGQHSTDWQNRAHFYAVAATTIRRILVDHARARRTQKRDFGVQVTLDESIGAPAHAGIDMIALDEALRRLESVAPRQARVVELRFFGGLDIEETAASLGVSAATVKRDWAFARAFLLRLMDNPQPEQ
ncbi:sigma-70 family RNA polymerase sigma factor [soil metagenome]